LTFLNFKHHSRKGTISGITIKL